MGSISRKTLEDLLGQDFSYTSKEGQEARSPPLFLVGVRGKDTKGVLATISRPSTGEELRFIVKGNTITPEDT